MKLYLRINKKAFPIFSCKAEDSLAKAQEYVDQLSIKPDIIFFDLPGTANTKGVLTTLRSMDFIFSPITADRLVMESTLSFTKAFIGLPETDERNKKQKILLFWNQVDGREKTGIYEVYQNIIRELELSVMNSKIMDSKRFRKEADGTPNSIFRSSLLPAEPQLMKTTRLDKFIEEFIKIINI